MKRFLPLVVFAGCSAQQTPAHLDLSQLVDLSTASAPDLTAGYPAGPYGNKVGDTIPPLAWIGYSVPLADVVATSKPYAAYTMDDLRRSAAPYAAVHVSTFF